MLETCIQLTDKMLTDLFSHKPKSPKPEGKELDDFACQYIS